MKVYVIVWYDYAQTGVSSVYADQQVAEAAARTSNAKGGQGRYVVEEYELVGSDA